MKNINSDKKENQTQQASQEGLPEISNTQTYEPKTLIIIGIVIAICLYGWWHLHNNVSTAKENNENFHIEESTNPSLKVNQVPPKTQGNTPSSDIAQLNQSPDEKNDLQKAILARLQAPIMINNDQNVNNTSLNESSNTNNNDSKITDPNTQYLNQTSTEQVETAQATILKNRDTLIAQGSLINAVLEPTTNSDLPGFLRAIVSEPVYSEDGSQVLISAGSRLIGKYKSEMLTGQSRVFIVWTRIIEPNGISTLIGSPDVDSLGESGQGADKIDYHFWQMFGTASLLSILGAGASNVGVTGNDQYNAAQAYRESIAQSLAQTSQNTLEHNMNIPPTLHINQGTPVIVFVAKDLRFDKALRYTNSSLNIF